MHQRVGNAGSYRLAEKFFQVEEHRLDGFRGVPGRVPRCGSLLLFSRSESTVPSVEAGQDHTRIIRWCVHRRSDVATSSAKCLRYGRRQRLVDCLANVFLAKKYVLCNVVLHVGIPLCRCCPSEVTMVPRVCIIRPRLLAGECVLFWGCNKPHETVPLRLVGRNSLQRFSEGFLQRPQVSSVGPWCQRWQYPDADCCHLVSHEVACVCHLWTGLLLLFRALVPSSGQICGRSC